MAAYWLSFNGLPLAELLPEEETFILPFGGGGSANDQEQ